MSAASCSHEASSIDSRVSVGRTTEYTLHGTQIRTVSERIQIAACSLARRTRIRGPGPCFNVAKAIVGNRDAPFPAPCFLISGEQRAMTRVPTNTARVVLVVASLGVVSLMGF